MLRIVLLFISGVAMASELPKTVAETTDYKSTSRYDDVISFVRAIQSIDPGIRVETFATTNEGRALPLVIVGPAGVVDPRTAHASGLPIVFIMANIHAGEVEGKEAAQMLLRELVSSKRKLREKLVILIAPIYNADGNEKISTEHRKEQVGPVNGVGVRENGQGLDLNRDYMKLESPEARGLVSKVLDRWDPLVTVDLHTTDGSYHGYQLTYAPMLTPDAD
ncbi:MAG TPA: M14 family zinc carboxypeptidase, partial [Thermoanaerobaculia bacterium]|nr:M14 family zinc carboxypeptidase [Thermoanaerobaculia bacterium]